MPEGFASMDEKFDFDIYVWVAGDDNDVEGTFLNWYTNEPLPFLPWVLHHLREVHPTTG